MSKTKKVGKNGSIIEQNIPGIGIGTYKDLYNAAENGNDNAQFNLALSYHSGKIGIKKQQKIVIMQHNIFLVHYIKMVKEQK